MTLFNPTATRILGYDEEELRGRLYLNLVRPDYRDAARSFYQKQVADDIASTYYEFPAVAKDGSEIWFGQNLQIVRKNGRFAGAQAVARDITERKMMEDALQESEERLMMALEAANMVTWDWDLLIDQVKWSGQERKLYGLIPGASLETAQSLLDLVHPEDRDMLRRVVARAMKERTEYSGEYRVIWPDGSIHWLSAKGEILRDPQGQPLRTIGVVQDVTRRKLMEDAQRESEERLMMALDAANMGTWEWNIATGQLKWSGQQYKLYGLAPGSFDGTTERLFEIIHPEDRDKIRESIARAIKEGAEHNVEYRITRPDGEICWMVARGDVVRSPEGRAVRMLGVTYEVTERKRSQEELQQAKEAAESASRAKSEFLANISHEIRTPMNGLMGMLELTLRTRLALKQKEFIQTALSSADSLLRLLNDVLDFSRIEAGKLELEAAAFSLRANLSDTLKPLVLQSHARGLELIQRVAADVPDTLVGDAGRFNQVIRNLVSNAIKFTSRGEIVTKVELESRNRGAVCLKVAVSDTGIGIPADKQKIIFDAFTQADSSTTRLYGGAGLGLAICSHLVEMMGGEIWVESEDERGSRFYFTARFGLPQRVDEPTEELKEIIQATIAPMEISEALRRLRILLAEDNPINQMVAIAILEERGHSVTAVGNGKDAVERMKRESFDLVLMDVQMPDMDGLQTTAAIRQMERATNTRVPIIAMTAHVMKGDRERCLAAGMDGYISKPIRIEELISEVESRAQSHQLNDPVQRAFDLDSTLNLVGGKKHMMKKIAEAFINQSPDLLSEIQKAIASGDSKILERAAHKFKSSLSYFSAQSAAEAVLRLEEMGKSGNLSGAGSVYLILKEDVSHLEKALNCLLIEL